MEGHGVHVCVEGSRYEGHLRANYRDGHGRCQWGNRHDTPFRHGVAYVFIAFVGEIGGCDRLVRAGLTYSPHVMTCDRAMS